jgi:hypothetical protein
MFSYLNFIIYDFFQLALATLFRVQNLSQTACTDFGGKIAQLGSTQHHPK